MLSEFKKAIVPMLILTVVFTAALLYRSYFVEPEMEQAYAKIYGTEEVGH